LFLNRELARVLQNRGANGNARENGWKEVTVRAGSKGHNSRKLEKGKLELSNNKIQTNKQI
jgi:hypothetical protein